MTVKISNFRKSEMADGRHLEKSKDGDILATDCPISTKFGTMTHIDPLKLTDS